MKTIIIKQSAGSFAENKDIARDLRAKIITPSLKVNEEVIIDFTGIEGTTQSFIHALISDLIRKNGPEVLDKITFKNCNESVKKIITIVTSYMQESI